MYEPQETACIELLKEELMLLRPRRVLFSTGFSWAEPFIQEIARVRQPDGARHVERFGLLGAGEDQIPAVVATHPMTRPEGEWVAEVLAAFARAEQLTG